jgi:hypothetical protein
LFAAGVVDTGGKLSPVSTALAKLVEKFDAGVVDTSGKFAPGVIDTRWCTLTCKYLREFLTKI